MKKTLIRLIAAAAVVALFCCGCNGNLPNGSNKPPSKPASGGTMRIASFKPDTLNPIFTKNFANMQTLKLVFESLFQCGTDQKAVPVLAEGYRISGNGLTWTITLRQNVKWHDGTAFTSSDAASSLLAAKNEQSPYAVNLANVTSVKALSANTLELQLATPQSTLVNLLDIPMVKNGQHDKIGDFSPIGTGPYKYDRQEQKSIYLQANNSWWGEKTPYIDTITVNLLPDQNTSIFAYEAKEVDAVFADTSTIGTYKGNSENTIIDFPMGNLVFMAFNPDNEVLADKSIRTAIAHCVNKEKILTELYLSRGAVADTIINPAWWVYNPDATNYEYGIKNAIDSLEASALEGKLKTSILVNSDNEVRCRMAELVQSSMQDAGIEVELVSVPWEEYNARISQGKYDILLGEMEYSTEINPAYLLTAARIVKNGDTSYTELLNSLQHQTTEQGIKEAYSAIQSKIANELPLIPICFSGGALIHTENIAGEMAPLRTNVYNGIENWYINTNAD